MKVKLKTDEVLEVEVDDSCNFNVWGERNEEGTLILKSRLVVGGNENE